MSKTNNHIKLIIIHIFKKTNKIYLRGNQKQLHFTILPKLGHDFVTQANTYITCNVSNFLNLPNVSQNHTP